MGATGKELKADPSMYICVSVTGWVQLGKN